MTESDIAELRRRIRAEKRRVLQEEKPIDPRKVALFYEDLEDQLGEMVQTAPPPMPAVPAPVAPLTAAEIPTVSKVELSPEAKARHRWLQANVPGTPALPEDVAQHEADRGQARGTGAMVTGTSGRGYDGVSSHPSGPASATAPGYIVSANGGGYDDVTSRGGGAVADGGAVPSAVQIPSSEMVVTARASTAEIGSDPQPGVTARPAGSDALGGDYIVRARPNPGAGAQPDSAGGEFTVTSRPSSGPPQLDPRFAPGALPTPSATLPPPGSLMPPGFAPVTLPAPPLPAPAPPPPTPPTSTDVRFATLDVTDPPAPPPAPSSQP